MERAVGEKFDFDGVRLQVKDAGSRPRCSSCYFNKYMRSYLYVEDVIKCLNSCFALGRSDGKNVVFVEV